MKRDEVKMRQRVRVTGRNDESDGVGGVVVEPPDSFGRFGVRLDYMPKKPNTSAAKGNVCWFHAEYLAPVNESEEVPDGTVK